MSRRQETRTEPDRGGPVTKTLKRLTTGGPSGSAGGGESFVLGGGHVGTSTARRLQAAGHDVSLIDPAADPDDVPGVLGDPADVRVLEEAGVPDALTVVVATPDDGRNLLIAQLVRARFDVTRILVLVNAPDRYEVVADVGHVPVCVTTAVADTLVDSVERTREDPDHDA